MHHERLNLPLEDLHACRGDYGTDIGNHDLAEDVADEPVVPLEASGCRVLHREAIVVIWTEGGRSIYCWNFDFSVLIP